jgi:acid stress-induced BolA-like protein IbaG/YrbA
MDRRYALSMSAGAATPEELKARIEAGIPGARAQVTGDGHHFNATITASAFQGLSRIQAHRLVYQVFGAEIGGRIHALSIQTQAEENGEQA